MIATFFQIFVLSYISRQDCQIFGQLNQKSHLTIGNQCKFDFHTLVTAILICVYFIYIHLHSFLLLGMSHGGALFLFL